MNDLQCRMARAGLKWTVAQLAELAQVQPGTVSRFERNGTAQPSTIMAMERAFLETGKVRFEGETCVCITEDN